VARHLLHHTNRPLRAHTSLLTAALAHHPTKLRELPLATRRTLHQPSLRMAVPPPTASPTPGNPTHHHIHLLPDSTRSTPQATVRPLAKEPHLTATQPRHSNPLMERQHHNSRLMEHRHRNNPLMAADTHTSRHTGRRARTTHRTLIFPRRPHSKEATHRTRLSPHTADNSNTPHSRAMETLGTRGRMRNRNGT
jgi:hypothetical protein